MELTKIKRRLLLSFGIIILLLVSISFVGGWFSISNKMTEALSKLTQKEKERIFNLDLLPTVSGAFFQVRFTFTYVSNILLGASLILLAIMPKYVWIKRLFFFSIVYITITFTIFWFIIVPYVYFFVKESNKIPLIEIILTFLVHLINPIIGISFFITTRKTIVLNKYDLYLSSLFSFFYYFFTVAVYFVGIKVVDEFLTNFKISEKEKNGWDIYIKLQITIYPMMNFREPWGYSGDSIFLKVLLNLSFPSLSVLFTISVSWFWKSVCKIKLYNEKIKKDQDFLKYNKFIKL
ncbi:hypothetical protein DMC14_000780 [Metamycoplasma phocicerebrale]|uniref:Uncharacterized protein n=1 Tax=Metamycoplasma phocicerebrale TaxID=142649 RepID=A0A3Q9V8X6_9BACT|nr:hypothetical protein [Metamycoplasma phocicerebrale]AZZ65327.1 hypothetical protein DMC14_000780 [Metamycoplasma phocicerebrale]